MPGSGLSWNDQDIDADARIRMALFNRSGVSLSKILAALICAGSKAVPRDSTTVDFNCCLFDQFDAHSANHAGAMASLADHCGMRRFCLRRRAASQSVGDQLHRGRLQAQLVWICWSRTVAAWC